MKTHFIFCKMEHFIFKKDKQWRQIINHYIQAKSDEEFKCPTHLMVPADPVISDDYTAL